MNQHGWQVDMTNKFQSNLQHWGTRTYLLFIIIIISSSSSSSIQPLG
jgi:hypothetical protein